MIDSHLTYLWVAVFILAAACLAFLHVTKLMFFNPKENFQNPLILAMYLMVPPNMLMVFCYTIEHTYELVTNSSPQDGTMCTTIAFCSTTAIVAIMGGAVVLAYTSSKMIQNRNRAHLRSILLGNAFSWILGVMVSTQFLVDGILGPYQGLYCCIRSSSYHNLGVLYTMIFLIISFLLQITIYMRTYRMMKISVNVIGDTHTVGIITHPNEASDLVNHVDPQTNGNATLMPHKKSAKQLVRWGLEMVLSFGVCWFLIFITAALMWFRGEVLLEIDIVAAWLVKCSPLVHCIIFTWRIGQFKKVGFEISDADKHTSIFGNSKFLKTDSLAQLDTAREKKQRLRQKLRDCRGNDHLAFSQPPFRQKFVISAVELT